MTTFLRYIFASLLVVLLTGQTFLPLYESKAGEKICVALHDHGADTQPGTTNRAGGGHNHQPRICCHWASFIPIFSDLSHPLRIELIILPFVPLKFISIPAPEFFYPVEVPPD